MTDATPSFGDNVVIRMAPLTSELGLAGKQGVVYGETTPSITGVSVIGELKDDFALNVMLDGFDPDLWFAPELIEFIDHAPGTKITIGDVRIIRRSCGEWEQLSSEGVSLPKRFLSWLLRSFRGRQ